MKYVTFAALVICSFATACTVKSERTVVQQPVPADRTVVYSEAPAPATTTVYVPSR